MMEQNPVPYSPGLEALARLTNEVEGVAIKVAPLALARACLVAVEDIEDSDAAAELRVAALSCIEAARDAMNDALREAARAERALRDATEAAPGAM